MTSPDQTRLELLSALAELGRLCPQWRLGQMLANLATTAGRLDAGAVWDLEDGEALEAARTLITQRSEDSPAKGGVSSGPADGHVSGSTP